MSAAPNLSPARRQSHFWFWTAIVAVLTVYVWSACLTVPSFASKEPAGFYGLLTDAFLHGQFNLLTEPDPRLLKLANPFAGAQDIPRLHDASLFNGHYYLYFGPTSVLLLFAPWRILTGTFLADGMGTTFFVLAGFLMGVRFWWRIARAQWPRLHPQWLAAEVLVIGFGNYTLYVLQSSSVYSVPIACAYACIMAAFSAVEIAIFSLRPEKRVCALGIASLAWGLAVGSRPDYFFGLIGLGFPAFFVWWQIGRANGFSGWRPWSALFWSMVPAGFVGVVLAWYNFLRYNNPFEFGITYQLLAGDGRDIKFTGLEYILPNLRLYFSTSGDYTPYFPFVWAKGDLIGVLHWAPFALLALAFPFTLLSQRVRKSPRWFVLGSTLLVVSVASVTALCCFAFTNTRYAVDFLTPPTLCALFVSSTALAALSEHSRAWRWSVGALVGFIGTSTCLHSLALAAQQHPDTASFNLLARIGDAPALVWEKALGIHHGPAILKVRFAELTSGRKEPLVTTGFGRDLVYVQHIDKSHIAFGYFHEGAGGPLSDPIPVELGKLYTVECDLGSLYPPREHPAFYGWDESLVDALRRRVDVKLDGRNVLHWTSTFYPSQPLEIEYAKNPRKMVTGDSFSGQLVALSRPGLPSRDEAIPLPGDGPLRLTLKFPSFVAVFGEPLLSTGRPGQGDLVYVRYLGPNRLRFGHDSWSSGNVETPDLTYDPAIEHKIDIDMGPLHLAFAGRDEESLFQLRFDGRLLLSINRPFHASSPYDLTLGFNATGCSTAAGLFTGASLKAERLKDFALDRDSSKPWGPLVLTLKLPLLHAALHEPLLVTGKPGKGDFVYLVGVDAHHVRIGYDHWGVSGAVSDPVEVADDHPHSFQISLASLYPERSDPAWGPTSSEEKNRLLSRLTVAVDDHLAMNIEASPYPATRDELYVCENPIGGSTCAVKFTGVIFLAERNGLSTTP